MNGTPLLISYSTGLTAYLEEEKECFKFHPNAESIVEVFQKVERTFSGKATAENWEALFVMADLVTEIGKELSEKLGYEYPTKLEIDIRKYLSILKTKT